MTSALTKAAAKIKSHTKRQIAFFSSFPSSTWERTFSQSYASPSEGALSAGAWSKHSFGEQGIPKCNLGASSKNRGAGRGNHLADLLEEQFIGSLRDVIEHFDQRRR